MKKPFDGVCAINLAGICGAATNFDFAGSAQSVRNARCLSIVFMRASWAISRLVDDRAKPVSDSASVFSDFAKALSDSD
jgi:hypothetical protein